MELSRRLWGRILAYAANDDKLAAAANWIALVVAWNQPFYPIYIWWIVGINKVAPSFLTFFSTPFFLAVPALARRHPLAGRIMLPLIGIANGIVSIKAFGVASGVQIFLIPCALIGAALFRPSERLIGLVIVGLCLAAYLAPDRFYGTPLAAYATGDNAGMARLNGLSAATLITFIGLMLSGTLGEQGKRPHAPGKK